MQPISLRGRGHARGELSLATDWLRSGGHHPSVDRRSRMLRCVDTAEREQLITRSFPHKRSSQRHHLMRHATHHGHSFTSIQEEMADELYVCTDCQKRHTRQYDLNEHYRRHTHPFTCPFEACKYHQLGFTEAQVLKRHVANKHTPSDQLPYPCSGCDRRFLTQGLLNVHSNIHTRPFKCPFEACKYHDDGFGQVQVLKQHVRGWHTSSFQEIHNLRGKANEKGDYAPPPTSEESQTILPAETRQSVDTTSPSVVTIRVRGQDFRVPRDAFERLLERFPIFFEMLDVEEAEGESIGELDVDPKAWEEAYWAISHICDGKRISDDFFIARFRVVAVPTLIELMSFLRFIELAQVSDCAFKSIVC
jgi:hypothetical protein